MRPYPGRWARACAAFALAWLIAVPQLHRAPFGERLVDFPQFYIAGRLVCTGQTDALYPIPRPGSRHHPGLPGDSDLRPPYASLAEQSGLTQAPRFIGPPPLALLFAPIALLPYDAALRIWVLGLALAQWGIAVLAARLLVLVLGRRSWLEGALVLAIALNPRSYVAVVQGNVTPLVGLSVALAAWHGLQGQSLRAGISCLGGIALKYATASILPVFVAARRWRALTATVLSGIGLVVASLLVLGPGPFQVWTRNIVPTLNRPYADPFNGSLWSAASRWTDLDPSSPVLLRPILVAAFGTLFLLVGLLCRTSVEEMRRPPLFLSSIAAFVSWLIIFSPITWNTYQVYLMPLWSWLIWEGTRSRLRAILAGLTLAVGSIPWMNLWPWITGNATGLPPEPLPSSGLLSGAAILGMATARLWLGGGDRPGSPIPPDESSSAS